MITESKKIISVSYYFEILWEKITLFLFFKLERVIYESNRNNLKKANIDIDIFNIQNVVPKKLSLNKFVDRRESKSIILINIKANNEKYRTKLHTMTVYIFNLIFLFFR